VTDSAALSSEFGVTADSPEQDAEPRSLPPGARANNDPGRVLLPEKPRSSPWNRDESREINAKQSARPPSERPRHDSSTGAASTRLMATSTRKPRMQPRPCSYRAAQLQQQIRRPSVGRWPRSRLHPGRVGRGRGRCQPGWHLFAGRTVLRGPAR